MKIIKIVLSEPSELAKAVGKTHTATLTYLEEGAQETARGYGDYPEAAVRAAIGVACNDISFKLMQSVKVSYDVTF